MIFVHEHSIRLQSKNTRNLTCVISMMNRIDFKFCVCYYNFIDFFLVFMYALIVHLVFFSFCITPEINHQVNLVFFSSIYIIAINDVLLSYHFVGITSIEVLHMDTRMRLFLCIYISIYLWFFFVSSLSLYRIEILRRKRKKKRREWRKKQGFQ